MVEEVPGISRAFKRNVMELPEKVARGWDKVRHLNRGGQSDTLIIKHRDDARVAVLKLPYLKNDIARGRFKREVEILRTIKHANIVDLIDANIDAEPYYYITPFGTPLNRWWRKKRGEPDEVTEAQQIIRSLLEGLAHFHANGGVHRDIKPANVVIMGDNGQCRPVVIDFGLAHTVGDDPLTRSSDLITNKFVTPPAALYRTYADPPAAWDCLGIAWLLAWMLAKNPDHGSGRYHWKYHDFVDFEQAELVRAVMAVSSTESLCPKNASEMITLLDNLGLKPKLASEMDSSHSAEALAYRAAAESHAKLYATTLAQRADKTETMEATAALVTPLIRNLLDRLQVEFRRASSESLPVAVILLDPAFGDVGVVSRLTATNPELVLMNCVCGIAPTFDIQVWLSYGKWDESGRFLPFQLMIGLKSHPRIKKNFPFHSDLETVSWDIQGQMWRQQGRTPATNQNIVDLIKMWLTHPIL